MIAACHRPFIGPLAVPERACSRINLRRGILCGLLEYSTLGLCVSVLPAPLWLPTPIKVMLRSFFKVPKILTRGREKRFRAQRFHLTVAGGALLGALAALIYAKLLLSILLLAGGVVALLYWKATKSGLVDL
ncbi:MULTISPECIES: hypothetical protein [Pseudomonas]|uniref:hypothetical protein n=1 Tax=Pseudomonas TaxID=286 RepID=UPI0012E3BD42|nr:MULTISPECIES: hypothetical protein [Pseudomonas]WHS57464.1 hypothetical protein QLH64_31080 [Pseudomonas brassicacearum]WNZ87454.1 hypothetical protein QOM10_29665 [Pseudomonas sp. P108]